MVACLAEVHDSWLHAVQQCNTSLTTVTEFSPILDSLALSKRRHLLQTYVCNSWLDPFVLLSHFDFGMQPPDPGLLMGNSVSESSLSPAPQPIPLVTTAAAQASAFSKTALGVILGIGVPLTLGLGMFVHLANPVL